MYAPKLLVKNSYGKEVDIQQYLRNACLDTWELVARSVSDSEGVLGFEVGIIFCSKDATDDDERAT